MNKKKLIKVIFVAPLVLIIVGALAIVAYILIDQTGILNESLH